MTATYEIEPAPRERNRHIALRASLLFSWNDELRVAVLSEGQSLVVGRAGPADLILEDRSLSRTHARFSFRDGSVTLEDLDSTNGVYLNDTRVATALLGDEDVARLGIVEVRVSGRLGDGLSEHWIPHAYFVRHVQEELTRARLFGRHAAVVAIQHAVGELPADLAVLGFGPLARFCRYAPTLSLGILAEHDAATAQATLRKAFDKLTFRVGVATYPELALDAERLLSHALDACQHAAPGELRHQQELAATAPPTRRVVATASPSMRRLHDLIARVAITDLAVLVQGETGAGKELVARAVHEKGPRAKGPFKTINCATIPANLIDSMLFGHERGAFTGAERATPGLFEQASGGTLFLDEVGELSPAAQAALLRVIEQCRVVRVGGTRDIDVDVRIVAATHRDLWAMVRGGTFREDLMFRLDALPLRVPPLRERPEDIVPLAALFLQQAAERWKVAAKPLSRDVTDALLAYAWPGNVRQLKNAIERALVVSRRDTIESEDLPAQVLDDVERAPASSPATRDVTGPLPDRVRAFEIDLIRSALRRAGGNHGHAARLLGIPRRTLSNKIHAYGLGDA